MAAPCAEAVALPVTVPVHVRYEDVTPAMHVGNAAVLSLIEEARNRLLWNGGTAGDGAAVAGLLADGPADRDFLVVSQTIEYPAEMRYQADPMQVGFWIGHVGGSSFTLDAEIRALDGGSVLVRTESVIVVTARETGRPVRIGDGSRGRLHDLLAEPVALRPRPGAGRAEQR